MTLAIQQREVGMFKDAISAIQWAEELVSRPDVGSQIGKLLKRPGDGEPVWDIALTISARLADCKPKQGALAMKAIYGVIDRDRDKVLGQLLGEHLTKSKSSMNKTREQLYKLGTATVMAERACVVFNDRYPVRRMAYDVGVSFSQFQKNIQWMDLRRDCTETLRLWMQQVEKEMTVFLDENGWLFEDE